MQPKLTKECAVTLLLADWAIPFQPFVSLTVYITLLLFYYDSFSIYVNRAVCPVLRGAQ